MVNNGVNFYCSSFFFWFRILDWLRGGEFDDGVNDFFFSFLTESRKRSLEDIHRIFG